MAAPPVIWIEAEPRNPATGASAPFRMAGGGKDQPYRLNGVDWQAGVVDLPVVVTALQIPDDFDFGGSAIPQALQFVWKPAGKAKLAAAAALYWPGAAITVQIGPEGTAPALIASGKVLTATIEGDGLTVVLSDPAAAFALPVLVDRFGGGGAADGPPEWAGKIKPRAWGRCFNVEAQAIDTGNSIYLLTDPARPLQSIDAIRDGGRAADPAAIATVNWQGSVAATFTALQAAAAPTGGGVVAPSIGCVKWWTDPQSTLTCDLHGEVGAAYVETAAEISERIVQARGGPVFAAGEVAASKAAKPAPSGLFVGDEATTVGNALATLFGGTGQLWAIDGAGQVRIRRWAWGASAGAFVSQEVSRRRVFKPIKSRKLGYHVNSRPMSRGEIVAVVLTGGEGVEARLSRDNVTVPADKDGNLAAGVLDGAGGKFTLKIGNEDVSGDALFSVQPGTVGGAVTIDAAGNYKPTAMTALALTATFRATYNGVDYDRLYTLTKAPAGQDGLNGTGANAKLLFIINDRDQITYDGTGAVNPASQPVTFTLDKQNLSSSTVTVSLTTATGTTINANSWLTGSGTITAIGNNFTMTGLTITMSAAQFDSARSGTEGIILTVSHADGVLDKCDILRAKAGADGAPGSPGSPGSPGANAKTIYVRSSRQQITYDSSGAISPASQPIVFTAVKQNTTNTVTWRVFRQDEVEVSASAYLNLTSGDQVSMTAAAFDAARGTTQGVIVRGYITADSIQDEISVLTAPAGANGAPGSPGSPGSPGAPGDTVRRIYIRSGTPPTTPTGNLTPSGWSLTVPANNGLDCYASDGLISGADGVTLIGAWSAPVVFEKVQTGGGGGGTVTGFGAPAISASVTRYLDAGAQLNTLAAGITMTGINGNATMGIRIEVSVSGANSWTTAVAQVNESGSIGDTLSPSCGGSYTNTTGIGQAFDFRAVTTKTGAGTGPISGSYLNA